jgi:hypothetical protein
VRHFSSYASTLIGLLLATALAAPRCSGQDYWSGNGNGMQPMAPATGVAPSGLNQSVVPGAPAQPGMASRPATWPGVAPAEASRWVPSDQRGMPQQASPTSFVQASEVRPCDGTRIIGRVGSEAILESEVLGAVNEALDANKKRIPADQVDMYREMLMRQQLKGIVENKLVFQDAKRTIPTEAWPNIEKQLTKSFEEGDAERPSELDKLMKKAGVNSRTEFDQKLHTYGTSLERLKRNFIERSLASEWVHQQLKKEEEDPTYDQMVVFYRQHQDDFSSPARAEWEELMVRYSTYPARAAAFNAIARMGNQVLAGVPFAQVAQTGSEGPTAAKGGRRDWTSKGALASDELNAALSGLPVGQLSSIIEGPTGYHIIRVTRREDERIKPFLEAQVEIKQKISQEKSQKQVREYLAKIQARTPVWTIFDDQDRAEVANRPQPVSQR